VLANSGHACRISELGGAPNAPARSGYARRPTTEAVFRLAQDSNLQDSNLELPAFLPPEMARLGKSEVENHPSALLCAKPDESTIMRAKLRVLDVLELAIIKSFKYLKNKDFLPGRGLEPPRSYPLVPETSASTNSATRARCGRPRNVRTGPRTVN
jgi:hypothetical protein